MGVKITIPTSIEDITLGQYQKYIKVTDREDLEDFERNNRIISIFCNIPYNSVKDIIETDYFEIVQIINEALNTKVEFKNRFTMHGVEFGFIPNFDKITSAEWFDLNKYISDDEKEQLEMLHKLMAILFRPIDKQLNSTYSIIPYEGTGEWAEAMKDMPLSIVNGALGFFLTLGNELEIATQKYMQEALVRETKRQTTSKNGVGTLHSMN